MPVAIHLARAGAPIPAHIVAVVALLVIVRLRRAVPAPQTAKRPPAVQGIGHGRYQRNSGESELLQGLDRRRHGILAATAHSKGHVYPRQRASGRQIVARR